MIDRGSLCIVSVTKAFLGGKSIDEIIHALKTKAYLDVNNNGSGNRFPRGGHLVVAYEVVRDICNHPSSYPEWNKEGGR